MRRLAVDVRHDQERRLAADARARLEGELDLDFPGGGDVVNRNVDGHGWVRQGGGFGREGIAFPFEGEGFERQAFAFPLQGAGFRRQGTGFPFQGTGLAFQGHRLEASTGVRKPRK